MLERLAGPERVDRNRGQRQQRARCAAHRPPRRRATDYLVVEMGARGIGHIAYLCDVAPPRIAAALNVGSAHVGEFGGREQIALAKGEIVEALPADGRGGAQRRRPTGRRDGVADQARVRDVRPRRRGAVRRDGARRPRPPGVHARARRRGAPCPAAPDRGAPGAERDCCCRHGRRRRVPARRRRCGAVPGDVRVAGGGWRCTSVADGMVVVNDAYNANPDSMRAALEALVAIGRARGRRTIAVLGQMMELGTEHEAGHRSVGTDGRPARGRRRRRRRRAGCADRGRDRRGGRSGRDQDRGARRGAGLGAAECRSGGRRPREGVPGGGARMGRRPAAG